MRIRDIPVGEGAPLVLVSGLNVLETLEHTLAAAIALPEEERAGLALRLLDSIRSNPVASAAQVSESLARLKTLQSGGAEAVSSEDALRLIAE